MELGSLIVLTVCAGGRLLTAVWPKGLGGRRVSNRRIPRRTDRQRHRERAGPTGEVSLRYRTYPTANVRCPHHHSSLWPRCYRSMRAYGESGVNDDSD